MKVTFIHTSDWHIGLTRWFLEGEAQARYSDDRIRVAEKLVELATEKAADFIVCAGDVFDSNNLSVGALGRAREALKRLPVPVYLLPGNHDPLDASYKLDAINTEGVHVLRDSSPVMVDGRSDVEVVGAPLMSKHLLGDPAQGALTDLGRVASGRARILVAHGQVVARSDDQAGAIIDLDGLERAVDNRIVDYVALGDTHSTTRLSSTGRVWFSGCPEATDFREVPGLGGEKNSGNVLVVTVTVDGDNSTVEVEEVPVGRWRFDAITRELRSSEDVETFLAELSAYPDKARTAIKYWLTGAVEMADYARLEQGLEEFGEIFAALYPRKRDETLTVYPSDAEIDNLALTAFARAAVDELREGARSGDPNVAQVDSDALKLLYRLASGRTNDAH